MTSGRNVRLSGWGQLAGGAYEDVSIDGMAVIRGDVQCNQLAVSGKCHVRGRVRAERVHIEGKCEVRGDVEAKHITVSGWLTVNGNLAADRLEGRGLLRVDGLVNADDLELHGPGRIREIGGGRVYIASERPRWLSFLPGGMRADSIEGDDVYLRGVTARLVRGGVVHADSGCRLDRVEYRHALHRAPDAVIREAEQA
ncbi:hypothetical protein GCM10010885_13070 [Alicyclobacillus cellulosilyticus]|uniref:Cytoskeletal protein CcmA (Bactofilin family) n=1 Tax=Alicyclobacillus cellulosilyticus TaxID=1003997 RepID=A0A917NJL1_9BACL|nr:polymer-forming cytoskeletal protein [Alicyclobacillus cellulosilyticus]GGJ05362.1 hypothetical protein GCM10010885_13070 [Alicyclobacillus cellulosilyticus]